MKKFEGIDYISEFSIDGQRYFICSDIVENFFGTETTNKPGINPNVVGEFKVRNNRYFIIHTEDGTGKALDMKVKSALDMLTRREVQIVMLVAEGRPNKQIASQLNISEWTVSTHLRRIFAKLGVDNRAAMIYRCSELLGCFKNKK